MYPCMYFTIHTGKGGGVVDEPVRRFEGATLLDGTNVRLNWSIESDLNVYWIKFKNFLNLY
jgi:hypothetical protein